jgi:hypothetical protein
MTQTLNNLLTCYSVRIRGLIFASWIDLADGPMPMRSTSR